MLSLTITFKQKDTDFIFDIYIHCGKTFHSKIKYLSSWPLPCYDGCYVELVATRRALLSTGKSYHARFHINYGAIK